MIDEFVLKNHFKNCLNSASLLSEHFRMEEFHLFVVHQTALQATANFCLRLLSSVCVYVCARERVCVHVCECVCVREGV